MLPILWGRLSVRTCVTHSWYLSTTQALWCFGELLQIYPAIMAVQPGCSVSVLAYHKKRYQVVVVA